MNKGKQEVYLKVQAHVRVFPGSTAKAWLPDKLMSLWWVSDRMQAPVHALSRLQRWAERERLPIRMTQICDFPTL